MPSHDAQTRRTSSAIAVFGLSWMAILGGCAVPTENDPAIVTKVLGTDSVTGAIGSMWVSPGERWLSFLELDSLSHLGGLASIDLATGQRVEHDLSGVAEKVRIANSNESILADAAGFQGKYTGWYEGRLYLPFSSIGVIGALVVDNAEPVVTLGKDPGKALMLVDGPEWGRWASSANRRRGGRTQDGTIDDAQIVSAAWHNGRYAQATYMQDRNSQSIVVVGPDGARRRVAKLPGGGIFNKVQLSLLRVSPNETYLAIVASKEPKILSPIMRDDLYVVDFATGKNMRLCNFRMIANLQWSTDDKRIYLTGIKLDETRAAYVVNVAKAFGHE